MYEAVSHWQIKVFLVVGLLFATGANAIPGRDEASCIYDLAAANLRRTPWSHLEMEQVIHFSGPMTGPKNYTIYAESRTNSPRNYKIQFRAVWTSTPIGSCELVNAVPMRVVNSANENIVSWTRASDGAAFTALDPTRFPLPTNTAPLWPEVPAWDGFNHERELAQFGENRTLPSRSALARNDDGSITLSAESMALLGSHGLGALGELGGAYALQRYARPTGRTFRFLRRTGQLALALDAANRLYLVIGEGRTPSYVPLYDTTVEGAQSLWDRVTRGAESHGTLRVPEGYVQTFYRGNVRMTDAQVSAQRTIETRRTTELTRNNARIGEIDLRLAAIQRLLSGNDEDFDPFVLRQERDRLQRERQDLVETNRDINANNR